MTNDTILQLIMMLGLAIVGALVVFNNRGGIANKALEAAVVNTQQISNFYTQMQSQVISNAEERGRSNAMLDVLKADLRAEQERSRQLNEKLAAEKIENKAAMDELRQETQREQTVSEGRINKLQRQIDELEASMLEIRAALKQAQEEKAALEKERDDLRLSYTTLEEQIDQKIQDAVEKAKSDIRSEYENKLREYENQIRAKETIIQRLETQLAQQKGTLDESQDNP